MSENIKFTQDSPQGLYEKDDTGTMVGVCRDYTDRVVGIICLADGTYVQAPLTHIVKVSD